MKTIIFLVLNLIPQLIFSQDNELFFFQPLMDKTWEAEGNWGDGSTFKQEITYHYALDSSLIICNTKGYTDEKHTAFGNRNHGIRKYDKANDEIQFWEFDIFGGTTKGSVKPIGKDILYQYEYGEMTISEIWEYVDDSTYNFRVGKYEEGKWQQVYLSTQFKESQSKDK